MSRVLLDENVPVGLRGYIDNHEVKTVTGEGWQGVSNGQLIARAEAAAFDVLVTSDQNLRYQQDLESRRLALVILPTNNWRSIQRGIERVEQAIDQARPGTYREVTFAHPRERPRGRGRRP